MTDRELLERAARAIGRVLLESRAGTFALDDDAFRVWNPLRDDGDALRLAATLKLRIDIGPTCVVVKAYDTDGGRANRADFSDHNSDPCAATRRAIVLNAAKAYER
jgi:hypothetical protein